MDNGGLNFKITGNYSSVRTVMENPWWEEKYGELFEADFTMDIPFAPPGMDQHLGVGQLLPHKEWMQKTVSNWEVDNLKIYGPRDPFGHVFFAIRNVKADTFWGGKPGKFESRHTTMLHVHNGKITYIKEWFNPLKYLYAANLKFPLFKQILDRDNAEPTKQLTLEELNLEMTDEAIRERAMNNVMSFVDTDSFSAAKRRISSPEFRHAIWNAPEEMLEEYPVEDYPAFNAWISKSLCHGWYGHPDMKIYATDDAHVYFLEAGGYGLAEWFGNGTCGGYGNRYIKYIEIDDSGLLKRWDENLNPISKYNSINVALPTFPYLF